MNTDINIHHINIIQQFCGCNEPTAFRFYYNKVLPNNYSVYVQNNHIYFESNRSNHKYKKSKVDRLINKWKVNNIPIQSNEYATYQSYLLSKKIQVQSQINKIEVEHEIDVLKQTITDITEGQNTQIIEKHKKENILLKQIIIDLQKDNNILKQTMTDIEEENNILKQTVIDLQKDNKKLKQTMTDIEKDHNILKQTMSDLEKENNILKQSLAVV